VTDLNKRTLTVDGGGPEPRVVTAYHDSGLSLDRVLPPAVTLTGDRMPLSEVGELRGHDVVVLTRRELDATLSDERKAGYYAGFNDGADGSPHAYEEAG